MQNALNYDRLIFIYIYLRQRSRVIVVQTWLKPIWNFNFLSWTHTHTYWNNVPLCTTVWSCHNFKWKCTLAIQDFLGGKSWCGWWIAVLPTYDFPKFEILIIVIFLKICICPKLGELLLVLWNSYQENWWSWQLWSYWVEYPAHFIQKALRPWKLTFLAFFTK